MFKYQMNKNILLYVVTIIAGFFLVLESVSAEEIKINKLRVIKQKVLKGKYLVSSIVEKQSDSNYYLVVLSPDESNSNQNQLSIELSKKPKNLIAGQIISIKAEIDSEEVDFIKLMQFVYVRQGKGLKPKFYRFVSRFAKEIAPEKPSYLRMHSPSSDFIIF